MELIRYWFEFDVDESDRKYPRVLKGLGCGITARDYEDALTILRNVVFGKDPLPKIAKQVENVDPLSLDAGHIQPNMGNPGIRGVWFPLGYTQSRPIEPRSE